jgi:hypothetical protein
MTSKEVIGNFIGGHALLPALDLLSQRVAQFDITSQGLDNLSLTQRQACLFVSNHLIPYGAAAKQSQLSPDAFVI